MSNFDDTSRLNALLNRALPRKRSWLFIFLLCWLLDPGFRSLLLLDVLHGFDQCVVLLLNTALSVGS